MITNIKSNIRAIDRDLTFTKPIVAIIGANKSGKTSILDALALIISGYIPRLGKVNAKLASIIGWSGSASVSAFFKNATKSSFRLMGNPDDGYDKKQSLNQDYISKACFDARLFLNSGPTDRIAIIQASLGASAAGDVRQNAWKAAAEAYDASGGVACGFQPWSPKLFSADVAEFTVQARKLINSNIGAAKDRVTQYEGAFLTSLEADDTPPDYSAEAHNAARRALADMESKQREIEKNITRLEGSIEATKGWIERTEIKEASEVELAEACRGRIANLKETIASRQEKLKAKLAELTPQHDGSEVRPCPTCGAMPTQPAAVEHFDHNICSLEADIAELEETLESEESYLRSHTEASRLDEYKAQLKADTALLEAQQALLIPEQRLNEATAALDQHEEAHVAQLAYIKRQNDEAAMVSGRAEADASLTAHEAAKKAFDVKMAKAAEDVLGPVMGVANAVLHGILPQPLTHRGFNLGYETPQSVWVPIEGFSGSETEAALIAFTAGLANQESFKVAIMDEAGMMDAVTFKQLLENLKQVVAAGKLHQVFIAGTGFEVEEDESIQLIKL